MSFFDIDLSVPAEKTHVTVDNTPFPKGTKVTVYVSQIGWATSDFDGRHIAVKYDLVGPDECVKKRKHQNQKLKVLSDDKNQRDKAIQKLMTIDANGKNKLREFLEKNKGQEPDDRTLMAALANVFLDLELEVYAEKETNEMGIEVTVPKSNWVNKIGPKGSMVGVTPAPAANPGFNIDDDIPFN